MSAVRAARATPGDEATVSVAVRELLAHHRDALDAADRVVVLPDARYPFHPSTGMVTHPDVVRSVIGAAGALAGDVPVSLATVGSEHVAGDRAARYLGYESMAPDDVPVVDLADARRVRKTVRVGSRTATVAVPAPLDRALVVNVPSARYGTDTSLGGAVVNLAHATDPDGPNDVGTVAATGALDPSISVLDALYTYTGAPHEAGALLASADPVSLDRALAALVDVSPRDEPYLRAASSTEPYPLEEVDGADLGPVADAIPNGPMPTSDEPGLLMRAGYRLYTLATGDAYPPQLMRGR